MRRRFRFRTKSTARPFQARFQDDTATTPEQLNKKIATLRRLNDRSREILFYGSKSRLERMELQAWIGRNNAQIQRFEKQRDSATGVRISGE